jgi:hypothetical protein
MNSDLITATDEGCVAGASAANAEFAKASSVKKLTAFRAQQAAPQMATLSP